MPTNANTFNSRITSEALEAKFRQVFPSQGGAELPQDLFASGVLQPVIDFSTVAEGSVLPENLQTAWDFATGRDFFSGGSGTIANTPGFWKLNIACSLTAGSGNDVNIQISDGLTTKTVLRFKTGLASGSGDTVNVFEDNNIVVFLRSGDSLIAGTNGTASSLTVSYRQIADVNGNLVNPLGFVFT